MVTTLPTLPGQTFPFTRAVEWQNLKHRAVSGRVASLQQWTAPIYRYSRPYSMLRSGDAYLEWQQLAAFYNSVGGDAQLFQFDDPNDDTATDQVFGTGNGSTTDFQLVRALGGFVEPVFLPNALAVSLGGVPTAAFTESGGLITFTVAPAVGVVISWTGTFYWPCRFDSAALDFSKFADGFWSLSKLAFVTEPL